MVLSLEEPDRNNELFVEISPRVVYRQYRKAVLEARYA